MTTINILEDSNNPTKYLIISRSDSTSETLLTTNVAVTTSNRINVVEISKLKGDKGDRGDIGPQGPAGTNGVVFDVLPINSGGTNSSSFNTNKIVYYDGSKLTSSNIDVNNVATDVISNILAGSGLSREQFGDTVTVNANLGNGIVLDSYNKLTIDDHVITSANFSLSSGYVQGTLDIPHGGTNNSFFASNKLLYYDGSKIASLPLDTGNIVFSGMTVEVVAGSGLVGGGSLTMPNGSIVIGLEDSSDIVVYEDSIGLTEIVSAGTYSKVTVDTKGRVTSGSQLTLSDIIGYLGFTPWHAGNDGDGSGLDADLLDGQHGTYYTDAANLRGTITDPDVLPDIITPGTAPKLTYNAKGLIIGSGILSYLDIIDGLGYVPFDKGGGSILGDTEILGHLVAETGSFDSYMIDVGPNNATTISRGIQFNYGPNNDKKTAIIAYYPAENVFRIIGEGSQSGVILTEEKADTKYVAVSGEQQISGIKTFLDNVNIYGQLVMRTKYVGLPVFDIGSNNLLVTNLNADFLDNHHGSYYRNATNLTGILNEWVVIPHIEDRATVVYNDFSTTSSDDGSIGGLEYIPRFHKPSSGHPMVLRDSIVYQTGYGVYVEDGSLSVGSQNTIDETSYSAFIGYKNSGNDSAINGLAVGKENSILSQNSVAFNQYSRTLADNSISLGTHGETWIEDQIAIGGFEETKAGVDTVFRNAHGQISYVPLKYHGVSNGYTTIREFPIPTDKTIEYSAELLFTKQKGTGIANFVVTTGIVKNFGYRDPAQSYKAFKKTVIGIDNPDITYPDPNTSRHNAREIYNNSQERIYVFSVSATQDELVASKITTFEVTAPPHQYEPLGIEANRDPVIIKPISDHSTKLHTIKGYVDHQVEGEGWYNPYATSYRSGHLIRLSPFDKYPYNQGAPINLGENIGNITECMYFRKSGEKETYVKFYDHGINPKCPLDQEISIGQNDTFINLYKDTNFNFYIPEQTEGFTTKQMIVSPINGYGYKNYLAKNLVGGISGTGSFHVYQSTGIPVVDYGAPGMDDAFYADEEWISNYYGVCQFAFEIKDLEPTEKNWSDLNNQRKSLTITKIDSNSDAWNAVRNFTISADVVPEIGSVNFYFSSTPPFVWNPFTTYSLEDQTTYYYIDDLSFSGIYHPYSYIKAINDSFKYVDSNTLSFTENQLGFVDNDNLRLLSYPHQIENRFGFTRSMSNQHLQLKENDMLEINGVLTKVVSVNRPIANNQELSYTLDTNFNTSTIFDIYLVNSVSGVGFSDYKSFVSYTGTYTFNDNNNTSYTKSTSDGYDLPLVIKDSSTDPNATVPTGTGFVFILDGPYYDTDSYLSDYINVLSPYNSVAISSVPITTNGTNNIPLHNLQSFDLVETADVDISGMYAKYLDVRVNNIRIFGRDDEIVPLIYSNYSGPLSLRHHIDMSSNPPSVFVSGGLDAGDHVSYKYLTSNNANTEHILTNSLTVDPENPSFGEDNNKLIRLSDWLISNTLWNGYVTNTGVNLKFDFYPQNIQLLSNPVFSSNSGVFSSGVIATGSIAFSKQETDKWNATTIDFADSTCEIVAVQNYNYSTFGGVLENDIVDTGNLLENKLIRTTIYEVFNINVTSSPPKNTGVYGLYINGQKPYQTLTVDVGEHSELLRILSDSDSDDLDNHFNIGFNIDDTISGIINSRNATNKFINKNPNYSEIHGITYNHEQFSVAVQSGIINGINDTGDIVLNHPKIYNLYPRSSDSRNRDRNNIFSFLKNKYLQSGVYDVVDLDGTDIYIYDFANSFENITTYDTGILHSNFTAYNITDSKFYLWGRDFNGDLIPYPIRDRSAFFSDYTLSCASGYACVKISGVPTFLNVDDQFFIDIDIGINPQPYNPAVCNCYYIADEPKLAANSPGASGVEIGMKIASQEYINGNAYVSGFEPYSDIYGNNTAIVLGNQNNFDSYLGANSINVTFYNGETPNEQLDTIALKEAMENHFRGPYTIYNIIKPGVVSVRAMRPRFYDNPSDTLYDDFYETDPFRGVSVWRNTGSTGIAIMITGTENIQTDKMPNYDNKYMSLSNSLSLGTIEETTEDVLLYKTKGYPTGSLTLEDNINLNNHYGFNIVLNKYLSDTTFSGIYKPYKGSGTISSNISWLNAADWTISSESATKDTNILIRDLDEFRIISANYSLDEYASYSDLTPTGISGFYYASGIGQNSGISFRFGLNGGFGSEQVPPKVSLGLIDSGYDTNITYVSGLESDFLNNNTSYVLGPHSNSWLVDINLSGLNNMEYFDVEFSDLIDGKLRTRVYNIDGTGAVPVISNLTSEVFYDFDNNVPWVVSFDVENINEDIAVGIQTDDSNTNITVVNSGIFYTAGLDKWQGYIVANSPATDTSYDITFAITGEIPDLSKTETITLQSVNDVYTDRITNFPTGLVYANNGQSITGYFNFQKPRFESLNIVPYFTKPADVTVSATKITTDYTALTNRELYRFVLSNDTARSYNLTVNFTYTNPSQTFSKQGKVISYDPLEIRNIYLPFETKLKDENWVLFFDVFGGNQDQVPDIKLFNTPFDYGYEPTYNSDNSSWDIYVTGNQDILGRYGQITGIFDMAITARDITSVATATTRLTYLCPPKISDIRKQWGVKDKSYFVNLDIHNNCKEKFDPAYYIPTINDFFPGNQQLIYNKYNPLINKHEVRYSGAPLLDKWGVYIEIENINNTTAYDNINPGYGDDFSGDATLKVKARGLDTDLISVIGLLKLKELQTFSTEFPPLEIINVDPETEGELNQGEDWELSFDVIGGLANENYPPTIIISGLPTPDPEQKSACSGYYPDEGEDGILSCNPTRDFDTDHWTFVFTGISYCRTGLFPIAIKAFDLTGEDTHDTSYLFEPLENPGPSISVEDVEFSLYPNCQDTLGTLKYVSAERKSPCPYATGISGVDISLGQLPAGLQWRDISTDLDEFGRGTGYIEIYGRPTEFPDNNIYPPVVFEVTGKAGKKAKVSLTYNTSSIEAMDTSPVGGILYFPGSGYYEPIQIVNDEEKNEVENASQRMFYPYPSTGLFNCRSILTDNECPVIVTGSYVKFANSGLHINFGYEQSQQDIFNSHVFAVFDDNIESTDNGIYQLVHVGSEYVYDPETENYQYGYTGTLTDDYNSSAPFSSFSNGTVELVTFEVANKELVTSLVLGSKPEPVMNNTSCVLGSGILAAKTNSNGDTTGYVLQGKFRPSLIASANGNDYPEISTTEIGGEYGSIPQLYTIGTGVTISVLPHLTEPEVHEFIFTNCYETGSTYLSGVILPMPSIEITDPNTVYNETHYNQTISFGTRCAFGETETQKSRTVNQREVDVKYYVKSLDINEYVDIGTTSTTLSSDYSENDHSIDGSESITFAVPTPNINGVVSGCVYHLHMWRDPDLFPTFKPNSYDYMDYDLYWIHDSREYDIAGPTSAINQYSYPATRPVYFGSGITVFENVPFFVSGQLIGGRTDVNTLGAPTITNLFTELSGDDAGSEILDSNGDSHRIGLYVDTTVGSAGKIRDGYWAGRITGIIENINGSSTAYLNDFALEVDIQEDTTNNSFAKTSTHLIPVTVIKPINIVVNNSTIGVNYGNTWQLQFYIDGGNRPPSYYEDTDYWISKNLPIIEIDNDICSFRINSQSYNVNTNRWTITIQSVDIVTAGYSFELRVSDTTSLDTEIITVSINT